MLLNHYEVEQLAVERVKDALREVEKARLIRAAKESREPQRRGLVTSILRSLRAVEISALLPRRYRTDGLCQSAPGRIVCSTPGGHTAECY